jgi:hypothetical protein
MLGIIYCAFLFQRIARIAARIQDDGAQPEKVNLFIHIYDPKHYFTKLEALNM